ncbi:flagellar biosynthesis protein FlhB [Ectothiorhodospiraceae bacterium WFHF3C12]|nr:flagellar biosynthesis protein FlhB [Ectothiorhodospiraceae bacterium WFHF3C12]
MAEENQDGQEKTEEPTAKRQREAKEKGQVPRSRELNTTLVMLAAAAGLLVLGPYISRHLLEVFHRTFQVSRSRVFDPQAPVELLYDTISIGLLAVAPFAILMLVVAVTSPLAIGGWSFSGKAMAPKLEKIDPLKGLKRIFGTRGLVELAKAVAKVLVVGAVGTLMFWTNLDDFAALAGEPLEGAMGHASTIFFMTFFALSGSLVIIALVDIPYQIWDHTQKIKMTKQEVKEEFKETEGKPEVKSKVRQLQQQMAQGRMMEQVPKADVVVTNPTHFAVALKYDQLHMRAPTVLAKGTGIVALNIRELAKENSIPLFEAPPLARALYHTTELEQEIPAGLYLAVAQVLAYIYQLRGAARDPKRRPSRPDPEIPEEFRQYTDTTGGRSDA